MFQDPTRVTVELNGVDSFFPVQSVKQLSVDGMGNDDTIIANGVSMPQDAVTLPATLMGGTGNDFIAAGAGPATLLEAAAATTCWTAEMGAI